MTYHLLNIREYKLTDVTSKLVSEKRTLDEDPAELDVPAEVNVVRPLQSNVLQ